MDILQLYQKLLRKLLNASFSFWEIMSFHITPVHFYSPVPNVRKLKSGFWQKKSSMAGIDLQEAKQIDLLKSFEEKFKKEYDSLPKYSNNTEFGPVDMEMLYCIIRDKKPKKIIEVGSGHSTLLMIQAIKKNNVECRLTSIDPFPKDFIKDKKENFFTLIKKEVQEIPLETFKELKENDILFIDSSHVLKSGSDVQFEYSEILPNLNRRVIIHVHDIFLPQEYPQNWIVNQHTFFNEQYLLQAFLAYNEAFEVLFSANFIHQNHKELLKKAFSSYSVGQNGPGSFWIKRK